MAGDFDIGPADYEADMAENGKGDTPRPLSVDTETYGKRWAETFGATLYVCFRCDTPYYDRPKKSYCHVCDKCCSVKPRDEAAEAKAQWIQSQTLANPEE